ncbi:MAG: hypothetical protein WCA07_02285 [Gloeobacterales cyanobacterium]
MSPFTSDKILIKPSEETHRLVPHLVGRVLTLISVQERRNGLFYLVQWSARENVVIPAAWGVVLEPDAPELKSPLYAEETLQEPKVQDHQVPKEKVAAYVSVPTITRTARLKQEETPVGPRFIQPPL